MSWAGPIGGGVVVRTLEVDAAIISYRESGGGPAVVFLHSGPGSSADWTAVFDRFSPGYRLVAVNGPGQGRTSAWPDGRVHVDDYAALVAGLARALGAPVHLVGHSYGGAVALRMAASDPDLVRSLVVIEPQAYPLLRDRDPQLFAEVTAVAERFASTVEQGRPQDAWRGFIDHYGGPGSWHALPEKARSRMLQIGDAAVRSWAALFTNPIAVEDLERIDVATLVVQGAETTEPERRMCEIIAGHVPSARHVVVDGAAHMLPLTHPSAVAEALEHHLATSGPHRLDQVRGRT